MGAWGHHFNENDDAADWLAAFANSPSWSACRNALAATEGDYVEAPEASTALAAAEIVAAGIGHSNKRLAAEIVAWALGEESAARSLVPQAVAAVTRVRDNSELQELWEESDSASWHASIAALLGRLI